ncbi:hypothetical protein MRX96_022449 [Rhipicephalus microplus]
MPKTGRGLHLKASEPVGEGGERGRAGRAFSASNRAERCFPEQFPGGNGVAISAPDRPLYGHVAELTAYKDSEAGFEKTNVIDQRIHGYIDRLI